MNPVAIPHAGRKFISPGAVVGNLCCRVFEAIMTVPACSDLPRASRWMAGALIAAWFLRMAGDSLGARFAADDMMNIYGHWVAGPWGLVKANVLFFSTAYRPMGGLFHLPILYFAGLNPLPYHAVYLLLLMANLYLLYRFARLLSGSVRIALLAAFLGAFHGPMMALYYYTSWIYDVLCFLFYFLAFNFYLRIRNEGRLPNGRQTVILLLLYIGALNAKEMGVTLPVMIGVYELVFHPPRLRPIGGWLAREGRTAIFAGVLTVVYVLGKTLGPNALIQLDSYRPVFTLERFLQQTKINTASVFSHYVAFNTLGLVVFAVIVYWWAWRGHRPHLRFCSLYVLLSTLPTIFLERGGGPTMYIPQAGWIILAATLVVNLAALAGGTPQIAMVAAVLWFVAGISLEAKHHSRDAIWNGQIDTWKYIQEMKNLRLAPPPGSSILFLKDPYKDDWRMLFIAYLVLRDRTLRIDFLNRTPLSPEQIAKYDTLIDVEEGCLTVVAGRMNQ
jgi:hypothetical protein